MLIITPPMIHSILVLINSQSLMILATIILDKKEILSNAEYMSIYFINFLSAKINPSPGGHHG